MHELHAAGELRAVAAGHGAGGAGQRAKGATRLDRDRRVAIVARHRRGVQVAAVV